MSIAIGPRGSAADFPSPPPLPSFPPFPFSPVLLLYSLHNFVSKKTGANTIAVFYQFSETHSEIFLSYLIPLSFVLFGKNEFKTWSLLKLQ